jgi:hypothetical protein
VRRILLLLALSLALAASSCGPPTLRPVSRADPEVACPSRWTSWSLEVFDHRADREGSEKLATLVRETIVKSFPGCDWKEGTSDDRPTLSIEIHRFSAPLQEGLWVAAAEWSVWARDPAGRTLTEFEAQADLDRPNYAGVNNEKEALQQVFDEAMQRTLAGLRSVSGGGSPSSGEDIRPTPPRTQAPESKRLLEQSATERISQ